MLNLANSLERDSMFQFVPLSTGEAREKFGGHLFRALPSQEQWM
jgi:hypothetical protein